MWRIQGLVYRVLNRYHGNTPLRITQGHHHVEDDVRGTSTVLSTGLLPPESSSQAGGDGDRQRRKRTSQFCHSGQPHYTALDAVGWGAAAMIFLQVCRRIHSHFSLSESAPGPGLYREAGLLRRCGYRVLLDVLSKQDVLPRGIPLNGLGNVFAIQGSSSGGSFGHSHSSEGSTPTSAENLSLSCDSAQSESDSKDTSSAQTSRNEAKNPLCPEDEKLTGAADNLKQISDSSVPVILNIIGLENAKRGDYQAAFSCFLASAQHGYSKAQFNVGVCYEKGRGVQMDKDKAAQFYRQAATGGHGQAMYRYAKYILHSRGQQSTEDTRIAIELLEDAAASGVREAQAYLGVLLIHGSKRDEQRAARYLKMAADNGDSLSQLYLGQCYEWGFGVQQCFRSAVEQYQRAANAGNQQAISILSTLYPAGKGVPMDTTLRSIRSAPCFSVGGDALQFRLRPSLSVLEPYSPSCPLPHSWSTGSLLAQSLPSCSLLIEGETAGGSSRLPNNPPCRWTIGFG